MRQTEPRPVATTGTTSSVAPGRSGNVAPTVDSDLRTRVIDLQQSIDRLLSEGAPGPVGTKGAGALGVSVDRAQLLQLKQQVDAILAALDRR